MTEIATIDSSTTAVNTINLANNATLEGMTANNSSNQSTVYLVGPDAQLINNTIYQAGSAGSGNAAYLLAAADRCLLQGNTITAGSNATIALYLETATDNPIIRSNNLASQKTSSAYAIYFAGTSSYPTIESNTITSGYNGIYQTGICTNQNILSNKIIGTGSNLNAGIYFQTNSTGLVASNEVRGWGGTGGAGIYVSGASANLILNKNTLVKNTYGVQVATGTVNIQNSIISAAPRGGSYLSGSIGIYRTGGTVTSTYNDLFNNFTNYSGTVGSQANDITTNPRFVNPDGNDYQLFSDSPCKNTASDGGNRGAYAATGTTSDISTESYVSSSTGDDTRAVSTPALPWKTITRGLGSTEGTVYVRAGTYNAANGESFPLSIGSGQKLVNYLTEIATVDSSTTSVVTISMANNATLEGMTVNNTSNSNTVYVAGADAHLKNNTIYQGGSAGSGNAAYLAAAADRCSVEGNTITAGSNATIALYLETGTDNPIIRSNSIAEQKASSAYAIYFAGTSSYPTIEGNTITAISYGILQTGACTNQNTINNTVIASGSNHTAGMYFQSGATGTVASNEVRGFNSAASSAGIFISNASTNLLLNKNTLVKNTYGVQVSSGTVNIQNCIISAAPRGGSVLSGSIGIYQTSGTVTSTYNDLFNNVTDYSGTVGSKANDLTSNPRFVNPDGNDFRLFTDSPCKNTASDGGNRGAYAATATTSGITTESYVDDGGSDVTGDGTLGNPWKSITKGLGSTEGTVYVRAGTYNAGNGETFPLALGTGQKLINYLTEVATIDSSTTAVDTVRLANNSTIEGLTVNNSSANYSINALGADVQIKNNKINQNGSGTAIYINSDRCSIEGNTVTAGTSAGNGIYLVSGADNPIIRNNTLVEQKTTTSYVVYFAGTSAYPTIESNSITGASYGIYQSGACTNQNILSNRFIATGSSNFYAIAVAAASTGTIATNEIRGWNTVSSGGITLNSASLNLLINKNTIAKCQNGVNVDNGTVLITNNIIASEVGGFSAANTKGIDRNGGTVTSICNDLYANDITYEGTVGNKTGDIQQNPLFVDATNNDYHLQQGSPCDGTGTPEGTDMGAYDYTPTTPTVTLGSPNGGETWGAGSWHNITWSTTNTPTSMNLYYITSEASGWQTIATGLSDTGTYAWLVPNRGTSTAKVSIEAVKAAETALDESAAFFTITAAADFYVDAVNGNNAYSGITSEVSGSNGPWQTITYASTQAATSSTIHVAAGTYNAALGESFPITIANLNFLSSASPTTLATIDAGSSNCITLGTAGYLAGFDLKSTTTDKVIYVTGASAYIINNRLATSYLITSNYDIDVADAGDNILIQGNTIDSKRTNNIRLETSADNPIVKDNTLTTAQSYQTGVYVNWLTTRVTIEGNTITADQGIYLGNSCSNIDIRTNVISPYSADSSAYKGMFLRGAGTVASNEVRGYKNYDTSNTAAIYIYDGTITVRNNTLINNAVGVGNSYGTATIKNNIISAAPKLNSIYTDYGGGLVNSVGIWGRAGYTTNASYNNVFNNYTNYSGNDITRSNELNTCPRFVNPDTNDFRLYNDSPSRATADDGGNRGRYEAIGTNSGITAESYVSTAGNDSTGDGSLSNPWKTVTKAVSSTEGTVYVRAGNFTANETFPLVLTGGQKITRYLTESASIDATGAGAKHTFITGPATTIESLTLTANNTNASYFSIYTLGNTHIKNNTLNAAVSGVYLRANYCTVEGNTIAMSGSSGYGVTVHDSGDYSLIQNNNITANASDGRGIILGNYADNITVSGNTVEARAFGMEVASYNNSYNITNNILRGAGVASSYGIYASYVYSGSISSNEVSNFYYGIQADCNSGTSTIWNNTIVNFTTGIYSSNGAAKVIKNNIVSSLPTFPSLPTSGTKGIDHVGGTTTLKNNDIWNNETNYNNTSAGTGDISQNPRFASAASSDFRIYSDSPCAAGGEGGTYIGRFPALGTASGITTESYVSVSGNDTTGSGTLASPWRTVTKGLGSTEGTVYLRGGTYTAGETFPLILPAGEQLKGYLTEIATIDSTGISGTNTVNLGSNTTLEGLTVINAEGSGAYHTVYAASSGSHIKNNKIYQNGAASGSYALYLAAAADQCSIEGNTIQTGASNDITIYLSNGANDPIIRNNSITGTKSSNYVLYFAGASSSPLISGNTITGTYYGIYQGGALTNQNTVSNKIIATGSNHVYGIYMGSNSTGIVSTNEVRGWNAYSYSYGIWIGGFSSNLTFNKNTIVKCQTALVTVGTANITNNIIAGEIGGFSGSNVKGIDNDSGGTVTSTYNDIYANDITYEGTVSNKTGDLQQDPLFVNAANNDYHLTSTSPAIDAGDPASPNDPDGTRADMGEYYFDQTNDAPTVTLLTPSGGQSLTGGSPYNITWAATQPASGVDHVDIYYSTNSGSTYPNLIVAGTSNDGTHSWTVPTINSTTDRVRVIAVSGVGVFGTGESSSDFSITTDSQGPTVEVTSPVGGELWKGGDTHNITFTVTDEAGLLANSLYAWYSTDGGSTFPNVITREAIITSPFVWNIPSSINSQTVRVRLNIWDAYSNIGTGESAASFTIDSTPPTVTVLSPTGGEKWQGGTSHNLTWTATDNFTLEAGPITLQYSTNSGTDYTNIATGEANDGTYSWATPSTNTNEARVKVRAQDVCGNIGSAEGANFIIDITAPSAPILLTPANSSTTNDATTTFTWNASTDNLSGIASYEVIIDTNIITQDATTTYTTPDALSEGVHTWKVKAKDGAGIWGEYSTTWSFTVDITTPEVGSLTLRDRTNGSTLYTNELTVTVEANGVTGVPVSMRLAQDVAFTQNATAWLTYSAQTEYALTAGEGLRTVYYKIRDAATNESSAASQSITVDTVSPGVESILLKDITSGSTLESNSLTVTVEASGVSAEAIQMRIAENVSFTTNSTGWITYVPTTEYTFTAGEGSRTAYYQVRDIASNESNTVNHSIAIDTAGPSAAGIALKDRVYGTTQYTNSLTISLEVHDASGSPTQMRTAQDSAFTINDTGWLTYATTSEYTFTGGEGSRTAYFKMRDAAQNESGNYNASIIVDTVPPSQVTLLTPANNSYTNDTTPTMTWNAATDATSGVASYEVVIDTTQITTLGAVTTFTTADAESQGAHNWKVRAKDNAQNWGLYSDTWNLTVETTNPTVTLSQPRGGQTLEATASYNITWEAADNYGLKTNPVTLYFSSNAGSSWSTIQAGISYVTGEGTYSWTVPNVNSSQCRVSIEVEDVAGNKGYDISPANFTISNVQPTVTVLYPNGGQYLKGNTAHNLTWVATGETVPVTINLRYSTNSGTSWTLIASNESNDGTYAWTTPAIDSLTDRVSVEAVDGLGRVGTGQSAADFAIDSTTPETTVVAPNGGERIAGGSSYNLQWTATDAVGLRANPITFRYSTDSGGTWNLIAADQPNTSPYSWTVPTINSTTVRVSVEATDQVGFTGTDQSASDFIIDSTAPAVLTVSPTAGATSVSISTTVSIVFSKEMSQEVTQSAFSLTASPAVAGAFSWSSDGKTLTFTPTAALEYNTLYTVAVASTATDLAGNHLAAFSSTFTTAPRGDSEAPHIIIQRVDNQGVANTLKDGDYIPKQPEFKGILTDNLGVSRATIKFYLDDVETAATITEVTATRYEVAYTVTSNLEGETVRTHSVKITASDTAGNSSTTEIKNLKVSYESGKVVGPVLTYPTTYNPLTGQPARLAYNLTTDQDVTLYMLDISGQIVWTGKYPAASEGGKAGYNEVLFYGRSEISRAYLGNGIYIYKLIAGNRVIGTGRLAIF
ncbi:MAG: right-handed parallel beta-helix repeat-containing protein [Candidatus Margulisiibacteriota bacterium]